MANCQTRSDMPVRWHYVGPMTEKPQHDSPCREAMPLQWHKKTSGCENPLVGVDDLWIRVNVWDQSSLESSSIKLASLVLAARSAVDEVSRLDGDDSLSVLSKEAIFETSNDSTGESSDVGDVSET
ncbi:hypothetical protein Pla22_43180 [Rubripirellula amarantea]|uniref:Uncharacterized protein n=1 Tax=Rubripirellula amarantea TaxID=2527999 RepID=A0A5C5WDU6_9BACT|nr:hypothetical protein Pla22_43180 [Rubripirellula amarantea]